MDSKQDQSKPEWWTPAHDQKIVAVSLNDYWAIYARYTALKEKLEALNDHLAQRTWVGLTDEEIRTLWDEWKDAVCLDHKTWAKAIEAKLKEKNNV